MATESAEIIVAKHRAQVKGIPAQHILAGLEICVEQQAARLGAAVLCEGVHSGRLCGHQPGRECVPQVAEHARDHWH